MGDPSTSTTTSTHYPLDKMTRKPRTLVLCFDGTADEYGPRVRGFRPPPSPLWNIATVPMLFPIEHQCGQVVFAFKER